MPGGGVGEVGRAETDCGIIFMRTQGLRGTTKGVWGGGGGGGTTRGDRGSEKANALTESPGAPGRTVDVPDDGTRTADPGLGELTPPGTVSGMPPSSQWFTAACCLLHPWPFLPTTMQHLWMLVQLGLVQFPPFQVQQ